MNTGDLSIYLYPFKLFHHFCSLWCATLSLPWISSFLNISFHLISMVSGMKLYPYLIPYTQFSGKRINNLM